MDPFEESYLGEEIYGFKLRGANEELELYTASSDELDVWLDCFNGLTILTEIQEDYEFIREVGNGNSS